jgi:hypothetical protein
MPTCRRSSLKARATAALGLILLTGSASAQNASQPVDARAKAADQGNAAMERLRKSVEARKGRPPVAGPRALPTLQEAERRRAFDGLNRHVQPSADLTARTRAALQKGKDAVAAERAAMALRLGQVLGLEAPDMQAIAGTAGIDQTKATVAVLFVSSSIPVPILRTYAAQLERVGGVLAFRGMPGGLSKVGPMAKLSAEILRIDPGCNGPACAMRNVQLIVDPLVFRQHGVARVPALAMIPGDPTQPYCEWDDDSPRATHLIYGDAALSGLLEEYARLGGKEEVRDAQARLERR